MSCSSGVLLDSQGGQLMVFFVKVGIKILGVGTCFFCPDILDIGLQMLDPPRQADNWRSFAELHQHIIVLPKSALGRHQEIV
jgi:hypothetical protein